MIKIYLYAKDPYESKYQILINKQVSAGLKHFNDSKVFTEYLNKMESVYKNFEEYNSKKKHKLIIVFDDIIALMVNNKKA